MSMLEFMQWILSEWKKDILHWGHDISPEENQYESGLNFAISFKKNVNFIGKDSLNKIKDKKPKKKICHC